jgi:uncharacterized RDD family membrane protein YckC
MLNKKLNSKNIVLVSIAVAAAGLASNLIPGGPDNRVAMDIRFVLNSINLIPISYTNNVLNHQWVNYALYVMLLLGAIIYAVSKEREARLVRFIFSAIFISNVVMLIWSVLYTLFKFKYYTNLAVDIPLTIFYKLITLGWIYLAFLVLKTFEQTTGLEVQTTQYGAESSSVLSLAGFWQRLFHAVIDGLIIGLILYAKIEGLMLMPGIKQILASMEQLIGPKFSLIVVIFVVRTLYYLCFEGILASTPAKYLTYTRLVTNDGEKPAFKTVLIRTLCRSVPFNSLSFLLGSGWHDRWSDTAVVKERSKDIESGAVKTPTTN